ncbi:MAG: zinc ribbon domain-containing protein [Sphingomonadaceae bacterium]|jgi:site-specific DNA recombinase
MAPARSHSTPVLLSGIALCGCCNRPDATMMMMTGKGGRYQYYTCSQRRRLKEVACGGNTVVMKAVDDAVLQALEKRLFEPTRLRTLLGALIARSDQTMAESQRNLSSLRVQLSDNKKAFTRLLMLVENGTLEADDTDIKPRFAELKSQRLALEKRIKETEKYIGRKPGPIDDLQLNAFATKMRAKLRDGNDPTLRKRYAQAFVSSVTISKKRVIIRGPKATLSTALMADDGDQPAVRTSVSSWCTRSDSNARPSDS